MIEFPKIFQQLVLELRKSVKKIYGKRLSNLDNMFNVAVCNRYTGRDDKIAGHRDDERWLQKNLDDKSSLIASMTFYVGEVPNPLRRFQIKTEGKWKDFQLQDNSVIFFSNHEHRVMALRKKDPDSQRINLTFRTLEPGLLGLVGYGNFYRYMSIPYEIHTNELEKYAKYFLNIDPKILIKPQEYETKDKKKWVDKYKKKGIELNRYIKPLCSIYNYQNYQGE